MRTDDGVTTDEEVDAVFIFIGTRPRTDWLAGAVLRNDKGFVLTGRDVEIDSRFPKVWKERRNPMVLESSAPGSTTTWP